MLDDFIRKHDLDIIFLKEVTSPHIMSITRYETHMNVGTSMRGTAIMAKSQHHLTNIRNLPTGRAIAATFRGAHLINIYAPSGNIWRTEREEFYNMELTHILQDTNTHILLAGDFNCVLQPNDTTGHYNTSRALQEIVRGMALKDTWIQNPQRPSYTHYSIKCDSRFDSFYVTEDNLTKKLGIETLSAAFTDQLAVVLRLSFPSTIERRVSRPSNPPLSHRFPNKDAHFHQYNMHMAYVPEPGATEIIKHFKRRLYGLLLAMAANSEDATDMRITSKYPATCWEMVWKNLHTVEASDTVISVWYQAIHDILPTNERLATINLTDTTLCVKCRKSDSLQHRIVACG
jgi:hypothetical protein